MVSWVVLLRERTGRGLKRWYEKNLICFVFQLVQTCSLVVLLVVEGWSGYSIIGIL